MYPQEIENQKTTNRIKRLYEARKKIISLPPEEALEAILDAEHPAAVVHSFQEEDLYFLIHDIGINDAMTLLSLASNRQWEYILDFEIWEKDRIDIKSMTQWLDLLMASDSPRFVKWMMHEQAEFIAFYLFKNLELRIRSHDEDPSDIGDDFYTNDDVFYVRPIEFPEEIEDRFGHSGDPYEKPAPEVIEKRKEFLFKLIERFSSHDHLRYQNLLMEASTIIQAEAEEEFYRLRNIRLSEKGCFPFEEAIGIYQPIDPKNIDKYGKKIIRKKAPSRSLSDPCPIYPLQAVKENNLFVNALKLIETDEVLHSIRIEFAGLANRIISADQKPIKSREQLSDIVKKACGYINIGLECLTKGKVKSNSSLSMSFIQQYPLSNIFRIGYGFALKLKWRAERWTKNSWFQTEKLPLAFWGEAWLGVLGGLLINKPLFFDNYKTGVLYREFVSLEDINQTENILNAIIEFDNILMLIGVSVGSFSSFDKLFYKNLLLTMWAKNHLGLSREPEKFTALSIDEFTSFFDELWQESSPGHNKPRKIKRSMKDSFLNWLSEKTGLDSYDLITRSGQTFEDLFLEIEDEYGYVATKNLNKKYLTLFHIADL